MQFFDLTLQTPEENLAFDEALLEEAEAADETRETLRLWESDQTAVVVGRSSQAALEVNLTACRQRAIPVLRRTSGGGAIVAGRGCLMYAVVLSYRLRPQLQSLDWAHRFVLETTLDALRPLVDGVTRRGTSDLALGNFKFSGNSLRCKRRSLLYHGTLLYDFDLSLVDELLAMPPRQPDYRNNRPHGAFLANLPASRAALADSLVAAWNARAAGQHDWPQAKVRDLVASRYTKREWNFQR
jgi:lipoate-protein ligase A